METTELSNVQPLRSIGFNVLDEKRIVDDEVLRNFYSEQFGLQKETENTHVQTRMHKIPNEKLVVKAPMGQERSLSSPATSSRNIWLSSVYARHRAQMEYVPN